MMMKKKPTYTLFLLTMPTLVVVVVLIVLMNWYIPTRVRVDLTADRAVFTVGGSELTPILNSLSFQSITVEKFTRIELNPEKLEVADPALYIQNEIEEGYPESAWISLAVPPRVVITGEDETLQPAVTLESTRPGLHTSGTLDWVEAGPGSEVTLEIRGGQTKRLTVKVDHQKSFAVLALREPFQLMTVYSPIKDITELPYSADSLTFRAELPNHSPEIEITGLPRSLILNLTISPEKMTNLFSKGGIRVTTLSFNRQDRMGERETALVTAGEITYPGYPNMKNVPFEASDFIGLDRLEEFRIEEMTLDPQHNGIRFRLNGVAGHIRTGSQEFPEDHRLALFDTLWQNPQLVVLFSIVIWVFPTTVGAYRLYREVKR